MTAPLDWIEEVTAEVDSLSLLGRRIVFVSGNFNVVHPGHLRLLNFAAECGDILVVGVKADSLGDALLPEQLRLDGVRSIGIVDYAFILPESPDRLLCRLRPDIVVKGKEYEYSENIEKAAVETYGGKLIFASGEIGFSSFDLLHHELFQTLPASIRKSPDYLRRHGFTLSELADIVRKFSELRVVVVGDLIVDEYISCDALGMSQEDPTLVVSPIARDRFVGGAGIVAAHAAGFGARVQYFAVVGEDDIAGYARNTLQDYGVEAEFLNDASRPTSLKQRYRVGDKTLLRVSHLRQHDISEELASAMVRRIIKALNDCDLLIFADFNYGVLPQRLVDQVVRACKSRGIMMVADSQASSQIGDVSRFKGMTLLTPTEREARLAMRDTRSGLVVLADDLMKKAQATDVIVTLGQEGMLIHSPASADPLFTDRLPAFNLAPKDVSGAGDSLLTCTSMARAVGANIWKGAYLGAIAAACQVGRVGNRPLLAAQLIAELER